MSAARKTVPQVLNNSTAKPFSYTAPGVQAPFSYLQPAGHAPFSYLNASGNPPPMLLRRGA